MASSRTLALVASLGRRFFDRFKGAVLGVQEYVLLSWQGLGAIFTAPHYPREIVAQMDSLGVGSLSIVVLTGVFTGMVLTLQSAIEAETHEYTQMYPGMARTAREEGLPEIAEWFEALARGGADARLVVEHPHYRAEAALGPETCRALQEDLSA